MFVGLATDRRRVDAEGSRDAATLALRKMFLVMADMGDQCRESCHTENESVRFLRTRINLIRTMIGGPRRLVVSLPAVDMFL